MSETMSERGWIRFEVGKRVYALALEAIAEVTKATRPHMIPRVPLDVACVVNFRGEPLAAVDGGAALGADSSSEHQHMLVLQEGGLRIGLLVSQVTRIDRSLPSLRRSEDEEIELDTPPEVDCVDWFNEGETLFGLVDPTGLMQRARELLTEQREGESGPCHNAF